MGHSSHLGSSTSVQGCFWNVRASLGGACMGRAIRKAGVRMFTSSRGMYIAQGRNRGPDKSMNMPKIT